MIGLHTHVAVTACAAPLSPSRTATPTAPGKTIFNYYFGEVGSSEFRGWVAGRGGDGWCGFWVCWQRGILGGRFLWVLQSACAATKHSGSGRDAQSRRTVVMRGRGVQRWHPSALLFLLMPSWLSATRAPNLVLLLADDLGYADVSFNSAARLLPTPHIDAIAADGVRCTDAYVTAPICSPSRAGLLTGRYQGRFGYRGNPTMSPFEPLAGLPDDEETLARVLGRVGYDSLAVGKWHLGTHESNQPLARGFDHFYGFLEGSHVYTTADYTLRDLTAVGSRGAWSSTYLRRDGDVAPPPYTHAYISDELTAAAIAFIAAHATSDSDAAGAAAVMAPPAQVSYARSRAPFLIYLAYNAPHSPRAAASRHYDLFTHVADTTRRMYCAVVAAMDDAIGELTRALRVAQQYNDTLLVFTNDNGGKSPGPADNTPLNGGKGGAGGEGGVRVPFAMTWPRMLRAGQTYTHPISVLDVYATVVAAAGARPRHVIDGTDLVPHLTGALPATALPHAYLFWSNGDTGFTVRAGQWKLSRPINASHNGSAWVYAGPPGPAELYDLADSTDESVELSGAHPEVVQRMTLAWLDWNSRNAADRPFPRLREDEWWRRPQPPRPPPAPPRAPPGHAPDCTVPEQDQQAAVRSSAESAPRGGSAHATFVRCLVSSAYCPLPEESTT